MAVGRHGGNDPEEVSGAQHIAPLLGNYLHVFGNPHLPLADYKKVVRILFALNHNVGFFLKVNKA
jgi:hypothetical protein